MYSTLLFFHSAIRWLVLGSVLFALGRGLSGWFGNTKYTKSDNLLRHSTATIAHIQLMIGYVLYFNSPVVSYFREHYKEAGRQFDFLFFGLIHVILMTLAIILITIGSAVAKRKETDRAKFKTMAIWFFLALLLILVAIPWPFSPFANRPYIRSY